MAHVSANFRNHTLAQVGRWVCAPGSSQDPLAEAPTGAKTKAPHYCGQCVSYVKIVCPSLPATNLWKKGLPVKSNKGILPGTAIATFNADGHYDGHAAIYVSQIDLGINVYDQWMTPPTPKAIGPRLLRFGAPVRSNNGDLFHVVE